MRRVGIQDILNVKVFSFILDKIYAITFPVPPGSDGPENKTRRLKLKNFNSFNFMACFLLNTFNYGGKQYAGKKRGMIMSFKPNRENQL